MPTGVTVRDNESFEQALRRFKRKCEKAGILSEVKRRRFYEKPSERRKREMIQARKKMLRKMAKQRRESIAQYSKAGRDDLVEQENFELELLKTYLPEQLDEAEIDAMIEATIQSTGAASVKDMGKVMGQLKARAGGVLPYKGVVLTEEVCINALGVLRVQENHLKGGA